VEDDDNDIQGRRDGVPGVQEADFVEGQNVGIEFRSAEDRVDRLTALVADN
jgi:hypothetical protein